MALSLVELRNLLFLVFLGILICRVDFGLVGLSGFRQLLRSDLLFDDHPQLLRPANHSVSNETSDDTGEQGTSIRAVLSLVDFRSFDFLDLVHFLVFHSKILLFKSNFCCLVLHNRRCKICAYQR